MVFDASLRRWKGSVRCGCGTVRYRLALLAFSFWRCCAELGGPCGFGYSGLCLNMLGCVLGRGSGTPHVGTLDVWRRSRLAMVNRRGSNYSPTL